jgi:hypothetical protein
VSNASGLWNIVGCRVSENVGDLFFKVYRNLKKGIIFEMAEMCEIFGKWGSELQIIVIGIGLVYHFFLLRSLENVAGLETDRLIIFSK